MSSCHQSGDITNHWKPLQTSLQPQYCCIVSCKKCYTDHGSSFAFFAKKVSVVAIKDSTCSKKVIYKRPRPHGKKLLLLQTIVLWWVANSPLVRFSVHRVVVWVTQKWNCCFINYITSYIWYWNQFFISGLPRKAGYSIFVKPNTSDSEIENPWPLDRKPSESKSYIWYLWSQVVIYYTQMKPRIRPMSYI